MKTNIKPVLIALAIALSPVAALAQDLFVTCYDGSSSTVYNFTTNGMGSPFVTVPNYVYGLAVDSAGNLFAAAQGSMGTNFIYKFTPKGTRSVFASSQFYEFYGGLAVDSKDDLLTLAYGGSLYNGYILKFDTNGVQSLFASLWYGTGLALDKADNVFVSCPAACFDCSDDVIYKFTPTGTGSIFATNLNSVYGAMACDGAGNLFASHGDTIYKFTPNGSCSTFASSYGYGLAFDNAGNLLASDPTAATYINLLLMEPKALLPAG